MASLVTHIAFTRKIYEVATDKSKYLCFKGGQHLVGGRTDKNLRTKDIAQCARTVFEFYREEPLSAKKKAQLMGELNVALTAYKDRVNKSKSWFSRTFCCLSKGERLLRKTIADTKIQEYGKKLQAFEAIQSRDVDLNSSENSWIQLGHKVYESSCGFDQDFIAESTPLLALQSYLEDLTQYAKNNLISQNIIKALQFAVSIAKLDECEGNNQVSRKEIIAERNLRIFEKIQDLKESGKVGDQILIPGKDPHGGVESVLFQIVKTHDTCFSVTAIVSQSEPSRHYPHAKKINFLERRCEFDELNLQFIENLEKNYTTLFTRLYNQSERFVYPKRKMRSDFRVVSSWIKQEMKKGLVSYKKFKYHVTEQELDKQKGSLSMTSALLFSGDSVLEKRKPKQ